MRPERIAGAGWLALLGGGEFSFGETEAADRAWLARAPDGEIGFVPAASGSTEYGGHFATYLRDVFDREASTIPIYRARDARRAKNVARLEAAAAVYLGGGVADRLLDALRETPALEALEAKLAGGGTVAAIAAAAHGLGSVARSLRGARALAGLGWLPGAVVETNFDPAHDRRLRTLLEHPDARWGLGLPAGSALLLGPGGETEVVGTIVLLPGPESDYQVLSGDPSDG